MKTIDERITVNNEITRDILEHLTMIRFFVISLDMDNNPTNMNNLRLFDHKLELITTTLYDNTVLEVEKESSGDKK